MNLFDLNGYAPTCLDLLVHFVPGLLFYQMIGAARHIGAHALMYKMGGYVVSELKLYPHLYHRQFYWAYYRTAPCGGAKYNGAMELAPYLFAVLSILFWFFIMLMWPEAWSTALIVSWHKKVVFTMLFLISPVVDVLFNVFRFMFRQGDFYRAYTRWKVYR